MYRYDTRHSAPEQALRSAQANCHTGTCTLSTNFWPMCAGSEEAVFVMKRRNSEQDPHPAQGTVEYSPARMQVAHCGGTLSHPPANQRAKVLSLLRRDSPTHQFPS